MKPTLLNEFPAMLRENHCLMSRGVITVMKVARQYDNRIKLLEQIDNRLSIAHYQDQIHDLEGDLRYLVCFIALPLAEEERDQGWQFIENGGQFIKQVNFKALDLVTFKKIDKIFRLRILGEMLKQHRCLEKTREILEVEA